MFPAGWVVLTVLSLLKAQVISRAVTVFKLIRKKHLHIVIITTSPFHIITDVQGLWASPTVG